MLKNYHKRLHLSEDSHLTEAQSMKMQHINSNRGVILLGFATETVCCNRPEIELNR